ncbi:putative ATP synthase F0, A subunit [Necator americanus]|uniref:Putative ATP synthase F0, A subunit n=1 Tax=Necator americanus TaxID=51031 RepID=W2T1K2_NECAM|nr:putative ATP synthase F0, A subunit [Necator americanus]ETN75449.1 putative ATP synthase F0, A subunit [Necator americanus]
MGNFRYIILFASTISSTFIYSNRVVFGFTVICQEPENKSSNITLNDLKKTIKNYEKITTLPIPQQKHGCSQRQLLACVWDPFHFYWAYKFDTRIIIMAYGLISTMGTVLYPLADSIGFLPSLICRFVAGFAQASQLHIANEVVLTWASQTESSLFFSILLAASQFGPLFTMILGGEMCSTSFGWETTYYVLGILTLLSTLIFAFIYTQDVETNRQVVLIFDFNRVLRKVKSGLRNKPLIVQFLSASEMSLIVEGRKAVTKKSPVPYLDLFADVTIWTSFIMFIGYYVGMIIYQQYSPTFIKQVLNYTVRETGYFAAIPMIFAIILKVGIGKVIDHGLGLSAKWRLAAPLLVLETLSAASIFLTGFPFSLVYQPLKFFQRGAQHAHFALNFNMFIAGFVQILLPGGVQLLVPDNTKDQVVSKVRLDKFRLDIEIFQWATLFYGLAAMIIATTTLYLFCTTAKAAPWTNKTSTVRKEDVICSTVPSCSKIQV